MNDLILYYVISFFFFSLQKSMFPFWLCFCYFQLEFFFLFFYYDYIPTWRLMVFICLLGTPPMWFRGRRERELYWRGTGGWYGQAKSRVDSAQPPPPRSIYAQAPPYTLDSRNTLWSNGTHVHTFKCYRSSP